MIDLVYGAEQKFRLRHADINILGSTDACAVSNAEYYLNGGYGGPFFVEPEPHDCTYAWGQRTPSILRLHEKGQFNIEIPADSSLLTEGVNSLEIAIEDASGNKEVERVTFEWDPSPVELPITIDDLSNFKSVQEVGQAVNSTFDINKERNSIFCKAPAGPDSLFLIGGPHRNQEATYDVMFHGVSGRGYAGLSDFFAGHIEQSPDLPIKPGYCSAGLASITRDQRGLMWMAYGDCLSDKDYAWVVQNNKPSACSVEAHTTYRVRHQVFFDPSVTYSRFRIWPSTEPEPTTWLCELDDGCIGRSHERLNSATFGLFQSFGESTEWSNIQVTPIEMDESVQREIKIRGNALRIQSKRFVRQMREVKRRVLRRQ